MSAHSGRGSAWDLSHICWRPYPRNTLSTFSQTFPPLSAKGAKSPHGFPESVTIPRLLMTNMWTEPVTIDYPPFLVFSWRLGIDCLFLVKYILYLRRSLSCFFFLDLV